MVFTDPLVGLDEETGGPPCRLDFTLLGLCRSRFFVHLLDLYASPVLEPLDLVNRVLARVPFTGLDLFPVRPVQVVDVFDEHGYFCRREQAVPRRRHYFGAFIFPTAQSASTCACVAYFSQSVRFLSTW